MSHIVESYPLTKLNGGLSRLHSADEDAVSWLTNYGNDMHTRRRRLKMALFDRPYTTFYWSDDTNIALSLPFLSYLILNNIMTLKSGLQVTQGHSDWYHLKAWCGFSFAFHSNYGRIFNHL